MQDELDDLFAPAFAAIKAERHAALVAKTQPRRVKAAGDTAPPPDERYTNPANWKQGRGIALIHDETQTLLGNFVEWLHVSDPAARKLIRSDSPIVIQATEYVEGDWWLSRKLEIAPPEEWHTRKQIVFDLPLAKLGVHSPACPLVVHLSYGGIARVELEFATTFAQMEGVQEQLVMLPAGVNVMPMLSQETKVALRVEVES